MLTPPSTFLYPCIRCCRDPDPRRAKDSWTDRERRNLTFTDVALGAKRKKARGGGGRGWKTKAGGGKVFVASGQRGGGVAASGRPASKVSKSGAAGGRKKRRR